jgi:DNA-binding response OmpR family regulator
VTAAKILIAEDEPAIALSIEFLLRNDGFATSVATDGEAALRIAAEFLPDLLVLDLMLPRLNGVEVCRRLRLDPRHHSLKVLMLTARGSVCDISRGETAGVDAYHVKPFATKELLQEVRRLLANHEFSHVQ